MTVLPITTEYIKLQDLMKLADLVSTGGEAKLRILNEEVTVNGEVLDESYVDELALGECDIKFPYQVPENRYFVLGDHRATSIDSRSSVIGCVEKSQIVGKVFLRVWPLSSFSLIR